MSGAAEAPAVGHMAAARRPAVKFCGLCGPEDLPAFNELLPEYAGFVFWPKSKRNVSDEEAALLRQGLDARIASVGVFVDEVPARIASLCERGAISVAQLHGSEDAAYVEGLRKAAPGLRIWKAFEVKGAADVEAANASNADFVLLDAGKGAGERFDWGLLQGVSRPYALAGGLDASNVLAALAKCAPAVLDVSSGIEARPGFALGAASGEVPGLAAAQTCRPRKDRAKMAAFLRAVRGDPPS